MAAVSYLPIKPLIIWMSISGSLFAVDKDNSRILLPEIEGWASPKGEGFASELLDAVVKLQSLQVSLSYFPLKRVLLYFKQDPLSCFFGGDLKTLAAIDDFFKKTPLLESDPFLVTHYYAYTLAAQPKISSLDQLAGKAIGTLRGNDFIATKSGPKARRITYYNSTTALINSLKKGRIEVVIHPFPNKKSLTGDLNVDRSFSLWAIRERLLCRDTDNNRALIESFNVGLKKVKAQKIYQRVYDKNFMQ
ncbi:substrate-binding periplasmic protein [Pseudobacteriovorax antillogorgiicola]|uniref:Extracellular solute-binding protein, family 3 n=1 Tax=Pseudobacteriovorax antillogorgiicola TaxID=1513793 RepID=A0A1Y6CDT0_9BACT|nr:transporter substrate-binding domain-containing protein [Pseudobacteriovorax antillogorgiicola]TCS48005.1 extracellular solute-binding protein (family 3) [Pseudobacteriovorax antillogorgiicola]SMF58531.1 extracellular solute-binding protein, family 3 [Pseudobacteriovorax antillogorgiicola]